MNTPTEKELEFIRAAVQFLEAPSLLVKIMDFVGKPIEKGITLLPEKAQKMVSNATQKSLEKALSISISTIKNSAPSHFTKGMQDSYWTNWKHTGLSAATGAAGGFFGYAGLAVELPITTGVMLRSIASIADDYGHDIEDPKIRMECLSIFSLGSKTKSDEAMDSAYYTGRVMMSKFVNDAAGWIAKKSAKELAEAIAKRNVPALFQLIAKIGARFEVVISEKALAQAIPGIGALTGAMINTIFTDHFNKIAHYHFGIMALEKKYGEAKVKELFVAKIS